MSAITWLPVSLVALFWAFGTVRLLVGAASKSRRIVELKGYADSYGASLELHHGSRTSCEEATGPLRERIGSLTEQVRDRDIAIRGLTEQNTTLIASLEAMAAEDTDTAVAS